MSGCLMVVWKVFDSVGHLAETWAVPMGASMADSSAAPWVERRVDASADESADLWVVRKAMT